MCQSIGRIEILIAEEAIHIAVHVIRSALSDHVDVSAQSPSELACPPEVTT